MKRTLVIIKPDAINRCLIGRTITRFEEKGLKIIGLKMEKLNVYSMREHYKHHEDKPFYDEILEFMTSIPSILLVIEGKDAVNTIRKLIGPTCGRDAEPGTIRGDYSMSTQTNIVHASEDETAAEKEIQRFFKEEELCEYDKMNFNWIYCNSEKGKYEPSKIKGISKENEDE